MKKISYKAAAVILCLIMVLGFSACGGGKNASETAESSRAESVDAVPVYTNNYSGSGIVTTADGYYHLRFTVDPDTLK